MSNGNKVYGEIEIGLRQNQLQPEAFEVELRVTDPDTQGEITPAHGQAHISPEKMLEELLEWGIDPQKYGETLAKYIFQDDAIRKLYNETKAAFDIRGLSLRLRLLVGNSAAKLHGVRWELLCDPETKQSLATSERILFSRFMHSQDWRVIKLRPKSEMKALIAVAAPADLAKYQLADVDKQGEIARAREGLAGIQATVIGQDEPLTLNRLIDSIRRGVDILYLVCHGTFPKEKEEPVLFLQNEDGNTAIVKAGDLAQRINELQETLRLIVLASCESAGREDGAAAGIGADGTPAAQSALAPRLAQAGVPSVIAMQGKISMETVKRAMPIFFRELLKDGQIDRAMAAARGAVREQDDSWMPALFTRLKGGRIWYEPGFAGSDSKDEFDKWSSICNQVRKGDFVPILGPELGEDIFGGTRELAGELASRHRFPLTAHDCEDLAKVSQYLSTNQGRTFAQDEVQVQFHRQIHKQISKQLGASAGSDVQRSFAEWLDLALERCRANPDDPYFALAGLNAAIYLNASPEPMLLRALKAAGKEPEAVFSAWRGQEVPQQPAPNNLKPTPERPWVYHVFGRLGKPDTLVLTEDDFFDYLIASSKLRLLSETLTSRLLQNSLIFLGFRLDDWRFRVLFRMIVTLEGKKTMSALSHVGVQVNPDDSSLADVERVRKYLESYLKEAAPKFSIYWGTPADFLKELHRRLAEMKAEQAAPLVSGGNDGWD